MNEFLSLLSGRLETLVRAVLSEYPHLWADLESTTEKYESMSRLTATGLATTFLLNIRNRIGGDLQDQVNDYLYDADVLSRPLSGTPYVFAGGVLLGLAEAGVMVSVGNEVMRRYLSVVDIKSSTAEKIIKQAIGLALRETAGTTNWRNFAKAINSVGISPELIDEHLTDRLGSTLSGHLSGAFARSISYGYETSTLVKGKDTFFSALKSPKNMIDLFSATFGEDRANLNSQYQVNVVKESLSYMVNNLWPTMSDKDLADRLRESYYLDKRSADAVENYLGSLGELPVGALRQRRSSYSTKLSNHRKEAISRTQAQTMLNLGRQRALLHLVATGALPRDTQKMWITSKDESVCKVCRPMDGQMVSLSEEFIVESRYGPPTMQHPPAHPNCRCVIVPVSFLRTFIETEPDEDINKRSIKIKEYTREDGTVVEAHTRTSDDADVVGDYGSFIPKKELKNIVAHLNGLEAPAPPQRNIERALSVSNKRSKEQDKAFQQKFGAGGESISRAINHWIGFSGVDMARDVQTNGISGADKWLSRLKGELRDKQDMQNLFNAVAVAPPKAPTLHRGMFTTQEFIGKMEPGATFNTALSSWTSNRDVAGFFASGASTRSGVDTTNREPVIVTLERKSRSLNIGGVTSGLNWGSQEWITSGEFEVIEVRKPKDSRWFGLWNRKVKSPTEVIIRQTSNMYDFSKVDMRYVEAMMSRPLDVDSHTSDISKSFVDIKQFTRQDGTVVEAHRRKVDDKPEDTKNSTKNAIVTTAALVTTGAVVAYAAKRGRIGVVDNLDVLNDLKPFRKGEPGILKPETYRHLQGSTLTETLTNIETFIKDMPVEFGFMVDKNGTIKHAVRGTENYVDMPKNLFTPQDTRGWVFTHNHPIGEKGSASSPLSPSDIYVAAAFSLSEMRAVTPSGAVSKIKAKPSFQKLLDTDPYSLSGPEERLVHFNKILEGRQATRRVGSFSEAWFTKSGEKVIKGYLRKSGVNINNTAAVRRFLSDGDSFKGLMNSYWKSYDSALRDRFRGHEFYTYSSTGFV